VSVCGTDSWLSHTYIHLIIAQLPLLFTTYKRAEAAGQPAASTQLNTATQSQYGKAVSEAERNVRGRMYEANDSETSTSTSDDGTSG
jgi:hypothetical protein